jgi:nucleoid DNA-binding protein
MKNYLRLGRNPKTGAPLTIAKKNYDAGSGGLAAHLVSAEYLLRDGRNPKTGAKLQVSAKKEEYTNDEFMEKLKSANSEEDEQGFEQVVKGFTVDSAAIDKIEIVNENENDYLSAAIRPGRNPKTGVPLGVS